MRSPFITLKTSGHKVLRAQNLAAAGDIEAGEDRGKVSGCAIRTGVDIDRGWYVLQFLPGCFKDLARSRGIPMLWQHEDGSPIGTVTGLKVAAPDQVRFTGQILDSPAVPDAQRVIALLEAKVIRQVSAGVTLLTWTEEMDADGTERLLVSQAEFREISPCTFGALGDMAAVDGQGLVQDPAPAGDAEARAAAAELRAAEVRRYRADHARMTA